jgi:hypothetical protein
VWIWVRHSSLSRKAYILISIYSMVTVRFTSNNNSFENKFVFQDKEKLYKFPLKLDTFYHFFLVLGEL